MVSISTALREVLEDDTEEGLGSDELKDDFLEDV